MRRFPLLSVRYARRRPARAATTVLGVALGVALLVSVGLMNDGIARAYQGLSRALTGNATLELRGLSDAGIDARWLDVVRGQRGVAAAVPSWEQRSFVFADTRRMAVRLRGVDPERDGDVRPIRVVAGRPLEGTDAHGIALSQDVADALGAHQGERVELLTPAGLVAFHVVGTFVPVDPRAAWEQDVAMVPLRTLQASYLDGADRVGQIDVVAGDGVAPSGLRARLASLLDGEAFVVRPREEAQQLAAATDGLRYMLALAAVMALVAAAYLIANNVLAAVDERRPDVAVVRALGATRGEVRRWLLGETLALALAGSVLGVLLGVGAAWLLADTLPADLVSPFGTPLPMPALSLPVLLVGVAAGVVIAAAAAYGIVREAPQAVPGRVLAGRVDAIGRAEERLQRWVLPVGAAAAGLVVVRAQPALASTRSWTLVSLGLVLTLVVMAAVALPWLLRGVSASIRALPESPLWLRLAADSLRQHRRRTGAVAASLMITLTLLVGVFGMVRSYRTSVAAWVDAAVGWDLRVTNGDPASGVSAPLSPALRYRLEAVPGVDLASPERLASVRYRDRALAVYAYRFGEHPQVHAFSAIDGPSGDDLARALTGRRAVAVSASLAPRLGLTLGDVLPLRTPDGTRDYRVVAVVRDAGAVSGAVYVDREVYVRDFGDRVVDAFALRLAPGADAGAVAREVAQRFAGRYPLQVVSAAAFKQGVLRAVGATFALSQGLVVVAVLVALFGLLNAALLGAWQLRHQLGVLRALGAPNATLARTLMAEAWLTSLLGAGTGLVLGTLLSVALLRGLEASGAPLLAWRWPVTGYLVVAGVVTLGVLLAGRAPARVLRRLGPGEALRSE